MGGKKTNCGGGRKDHLSSWVLSNVVILGKHPRGV